MPRHPRTAGRACALVSGGADSAALVAHLLQKGETVYPVFVLSGYRWEEAELHWLKRLLSALACRRLKPLTCLRAPVHGSPHWAYTGRGVPGARSADEAVFLPGRNLVLLSAAAVFAAQNGIGTLALGTLRANPFADASPAFFASFEKTLRACFGLPIRIRAPFRRMTKAQVVRRYAPTPWGLTFSCLSPAGSRPCGRCNKCAERAKALRGL